MLSCKEMMGWGTLSIGVSLAILVPKYHVFDVKANHTCCSGPDVAPFVLLRANEALLLLKKEVELCKLQQDIGKKVEEKINKDQKRYFLMEQLRSIKKELGLEKDDKSALIQRYG
jgi:hypothetical protein